MLPGPLRAAPARVPGSVRRTSDVVFTSRPFEDGLPAVFGATGRARDLRNGIEVAEILATASIDVSTDAGNLIESIRTDPGDPGLDALVGRRVGFGFGSAARDVLGPLGGSLLGRLVSDLDGGWAPAAWGSMRASMRVSSGPSEGQGSPPDICAGWRSEGIPLQLRRAGQPPPFIEEPDLAPSLVGDDPLSWHELTPLGPRQSRRLRRLDLLTAGDGQLRIDAHFRDSAVLVDGTERVVHEYTVAATVETVDWTFTRCVAEPRVLPFPTDCSGAVGSAGSLVGRTVASLRRGIGPDGRGPASCTHLTDLLRTLADVEQLAGQV